MAQTIDGATISILADLGESRAPFILDRDLLDAPTSLLTPIASALLDITAEVIQLDSSWGANDWTGPMTVATAGETTIEVWDPDRTYDPANDELTDPPRPGRTVLLQVDGVTFQTLKTDIIGHGRAAGITAITCIDVLAEASHQGVIAHLPPLPTDQQSEAMAGYAGWGWRLDQEGAFVTARSTDLFEGNLLEGLQRLAQAELGALFASGAGQIVFRGRGHLPDPITPPLVIGYAPGIGTTEMASEDDRRLVNAVYISRIDAASPTLVYRDPVAISLVGGEVYSEVAESDLLLTESAG